MEYLAECLLRSERLLNLSRSIGSFLSGLSELHRRAVHFPSNLFLVSNVSFPDTRKELFMAPWWSFNDGFFPTQLSMLLVNARLKEEIFKWKSLLKVTYGS